MELVRTNRDLRVDFFRGLALWWIFIDHVPGNALSRTTLHNFAVCDAAEVFVLLAGYAAGISYGRTMDRSGWLNAGADVVRRAGTLYIVHIFLFVVLTAQVGYSAAALNRSNYLEESGLDALGGRPYVALFQALLLRFQPAFLDILPLYIVLLLMFALALPLLRTPWVLACVSLALYAAARAFGLNLPSWTHPGWYFNPLTWQFLFMGGAILARTPPRIPRPWRRVGDVVALLVVAAGLFFAYVVVWDHPQVTEHLPRGVARLMLSVDKTGMHPFRVCSIAALAWLVARLVPIDAAWLRSRPARLVLLAGQHGLPVFCIGILLSFGGRLGLEFDDSWWMQTAINVGGTLVLIAVGALSAWYREKGRPPRPAAALSPAAAPSGRAPSLPSAESMDRPA